MNCKIVTTQETHLCNTPTKNHAKFANLANLAYLCVKFNPFLIAIKYKNLYL